MGKRNSDLLGRWGENLAAEELKGKGYTIVAANWHCRQGEIDLIASDCHYLCFVEVKLRRSDRWMAPREAVDWHKQARLRTAAALYLSQYPTQLQPRFDVIEVYAPEGSDTRCPQLIHIEDAFS